MEKNKSHYSWAMLYLTFVEHKIMGSGTEHETHPHIPVGVLDGMVTIEEAVEARNEKRLYFANFGNYFGIEGATKVKFTLEPIYAETGETVRDPQLIIVLDEDRDITDKFKDKKYIGPFARE